MDLKTQTEPFKSWKKINEERKAFKKKRKQEKVLKALEEEQREKSAAVNGKGENAGKSSSHQSKLNPSTTSIAVPGSILENAQSAELRSYVAGQIARAACIFRVHEVIVFDDVGIATARETKRNYEADEDPNVSQTVRGSSLQLARILQYLECPQYLRKFFFPLHKDLKYSGLLNPLDAPHHLRQQNVFLYREGIITEKKAKEGYSYANVGLLNDVLVDKAIAAGVRVTVKLENLNEHSRKLRGTVVSPDEPRRETGVYWGYTVRIAHSLGEIFTKSPYEGGYDLTVGTSDHGSSVEDVPNKSFTFNHLLIVFGGLKGLETALANDEKLNVDDPALLFDHYVNVLPRQGSRTIRTEEALLIAMAALQEKLNPKVGDVKEDLKEYQLARSEDTGFHAKVEPNSKKQKKKRLAEDHDEGVEMETERKVRKSDESDNQNFANDFLRNTKQKSNHLVPRNVEIVGETFRESNETTNPFKKIKHKKKDEQSQHIEMTGDDFEVVPAAGSKTKSKQNQNGVAGDDLSRFD